MNDNGTILTDNNLPAMRLIISAYGVVTDTSYDAEEYYDSPENYMSTVKQCGKVTIKDMLLAMSSVVNKDFYINTSKSLRTDIEEDVKRVTEIETLLATTKDFESADKAIEEVVNVGRTALTARLMTTRLHRDEKARRRAIYFVILNADELLKENDEWLSKEITL